MNSDANTESKPSVEPAVSAPLRKPLIVPVIIFVICTVLGIVGGPMVGTLVAILNPQTYESSTTLHIEPRHTTANTVTEPATEQKPKSQIQHQYILPTELIVEECLEVNNLYRLKVLSERQKPEAIRYVVENLSMEQNPEEKAIYTVTLRTAEPKDSQVLLANIVQTYRNHLEEKYRSQTEDVTRLLREVNHKFENHYRDLDQQISVIKQQEDNDNDETRQRLENLEQEQLRVREMLLASQEKLASAAVQNQSNGFSFSLLNQAGPGKKTRPSTMIFIYCGAAVGTLLGAAFGGGIALIARKVMTPSNR